MKTAYRNPWHRPANKDYGPEFFETDAAPSEYRGFQIYERIKGTCWDVVWEGVCKAHRAGPRGAREAVDMILDVAEQTWPSPYARALETPAP